MKFNQTYDVCKKNLVIVVNLKRTPCFDNSPCLILLVNKVGSINWESEVACLCRYPRTIYVLQFPGRKKKTYRYFLFGNCTSHKKDPPGISHKMLHGRIKKQNTVRYACEQQQNDWGSSHNKVS